MSPASTPTSSHETALGRIHRLAAAATPVQSQQFLVSPAGKDGRDALNKYPPKARLIYFHFHLLKPKLLN